MLYHVTPKWDGGPLESLAARLGEAEAIDAFCLKWGADDSFAQDQVTKIYFYRTLAEAQKHQDTYGGEILAIDDTYIDTEIDQVEGHVCTHYTVRAEDIRRI